MSRVAWQGWVLCAALSLSLACGRTSRDGRDGDEIPARPAVGDQALVPSMLQLPETRRYFALDDERGPAMFMFEAPGAVERSSLWFGDARYKSWVSAWSPNGARYAYQLQASSSDAANPTPFGIADAERDFAPVAVEHADLQGQSVRALEWIGDHALFATVATYSGALDVAGYSGRYLWIDADSGAVTDLGPLPPGFVPDAWPTHWASPYGVAFIDGDCRVVYGEGPGTQPTPLNDCRAEGSWSGDGSFLVLTSRGERKLYRRRSGTLEYVTQPWASLEAPPASTWNWAATAPRFVTFEGGGDLKTPITKLAVGDAEVGLYVELRDLPRLHYANFVNDDLMIAEDWEGQEYALLLSQVAAGQTELLAVGNRPYPTAPPLASEDSTRLYYLTDPFRELGLVGGKQRTSSVLYASPTPLEEVRFRFLRDDRAGLLTTIEPQRGSSQTYHQYLVTLDSGHLTISLGSRDFATEIAALGLQTFQSAPDFGGIFYLGDDAGGTFVDWLGFDDIGHKVRLLQNLAGNPSSLDFPKSVTLP